MTTSTRRPRRSRRQRDAATVSELITATIALLSEAGYRHTSVLEICTRADRSVRDMFRQVGDRRELMAAAAAYAVEHELATFRSLIAGLGDRTADPFDLSHELRDVQSSARIAALREILITTRTDTELRAAISPVMRRFYDALLADGDCADVLRRFPEHAREAVILTILDTFGARVVRDSLYPPAELDEAMFDVTYEMLRAYLDSVGV
ncbi:TetR/AcrR family transcriptional regulator [Nocardia brasiliensis]